MVVEICLSVRRCNVRSKFSIRIIVSADQEILTKKHLGHLVSLLDDVSSQWESIATALELPEDKIAYIRLDHIGTANHFREALILWLNHLGLEPTRENLATALQAPPVSRNDLARKVSLTGIPPGSSLLLSPSVSQPTQENLATALQTPPISRNDLARKVSPTGIPPGSSLPLSASVSHQSPACISLRLALRVIIGLRRVIIPILFGLLFCYIHYGLDYKCDPIPRGRSFFLPKKERNFLGRQEEMKVIKQYLEGPDSEVRIVTLFGLAGLGKSTIAIHVGHDMLQRGWDVYYIRVEDAADVDDLEQQLTNDQTLTGTRLKKSAGELQRRSLLILDNVDHHWVEKDLCQHFLLKYS